MPLFDVLFKNENNCRENKKPGVLGKIADCLSGGFEKETDDRSDSPGSAEAAFAPTVLRPFTN